MNNNKPTNQTTQTNKHKHKHKHTGNGTMNYYHLPIHFYNNGTVYFGSETNSSIVNIITSNAVFGSEFVVKQR